MKSVLRALLELFPQIDLRILRCVAVEYPIDLDAAVEFILSDVLPIINKQVETSSTKIVLDEEHAPDGPSSPVKDTPELKLSPSHDGFFQGKEDEASLPSEPKNEETETSHVADEPHNEVN